MPRKKTRQTAEPIDLREYITGLIGKNLSQIEEDLATLTPIERLHFLERLFPYVIARQKEIEIKGEPIDFGKIRFGFDD